MAKAVILISLDSTANPALVARRLAADFHLSLHQASAALQRLPLVFPRLFDQVEVNDLSYAYKKLGCQIATEDRGASSFAAARSPAPETSLPAAPVPTETPAEIPVRPVPAARPRPAESPEPPRRHLRPAVWRPVAAGLAVLGLAAAAVFLWKTYRKPEYKIPASLPAGMATSPATPGPTAAQEKSILERIRQSGDLDFRITELQKALEQYPQSQVIKDGISDDYAEKAVRDPALEQRIIFFKMALSFNRKNLNAWYGLIAAYRQAGEADSAARAKQRMEEIIK